MTSKINKLFEIFSNEKPIEKYVEIISYKPIGRKKRSTDYAYCLRLSTKKHGWDFKFSNETIYAFELKFNKKSRHYKIDFLSELFREHYNCFSVGINIKYIKEGQIIFIAEKNNRNNRLNFKIWFVCEKDDISIKIKEVNMPQFKRKGCSIPFRSWLFRNLKHKVNLNNYKCIKDCETCKYLKSKKEAIYYYIQKKEEERELEYKKQYAEELDNSYSRSF